jgi:hypothetical protein
LITFRLKPHSHKPVEIVEICLNGQCIAAIYPIDDRDGVKLVSAHSEKVMIVKEDDGSKFFPHIPHVEILFKPKGYSLTATGHISWHEDETTGHSGDS